MSSRPTLDSKSYIIFVSSQTVLRVIASVWCKPWLFRGCKGPLRSFKGFGLNRIDLCWVAVYSGIQGNKTAATLARLGSLDKGDFIVSPDPPTCHFHDVITEWINDRTGLLLGFDKATLRLIIGFITGHCGMRSLTRSCNRSQPDYCRICCNEKQLETI